MYSYVVAELSLSNSTPQPSIYPSNNYFLEFKLPIRLSYLLYWLIIGAGIKFFSVCLKESNIVTSNESDYDYDSWQADQANLKDKRLPIQNQAS